MVRKLSFLGLIISALILTYNLSFSQNKALEKKSLNIENARKVVNQTILSSDPTYKIKQDYIQADQKRDRINFELKKSIAKVEKAQQLERMAKNSLSKTERIRYFMDAIESLQASGKSYEKIKNILDTRSGLQKTTNSGSISGTITANGILPIVDITIFAFDLHGYYAAETMASTLDGTYSLENVPEGDYYLVTQSQLADEFYNDIPFDNYEGWRNAETVNVSANATNSGKDFNLDLGATIKGKIIDQNTNIALSFFTLNIFSVDNPNDPVFSDNVFVTDFITGDYSINFGEVGQFKISAEYPGYELEFYNNQSGWDQATIVEISSPTEIIENIDFSLTLDTGGPAEDVGSLITGTVTSQSDGSFLPFVLVFAFDEADTSVAGFGLQLFNSYEIVGLEAGSYFVMATDLLQGRGREFYQEKSTLDGAIPVAVAENDTTPNIDFTLDFDGSISGTITNAGSDPIPDVLVVAVKIDTSELDINKLILNSDVGFDSSDVDGKYKITGISDGEYYVRTVSLINDSLNGMYLDEWYPDIHSLFDVKQATPVIVDGLDETVNKDFVLEKAGVICGKVLNSDGSAPVLDVAAIVALNVTNNIPQLAPFEYDDSDDGTYYISTLEGGDYILFAFVDPEVDGMYISEFYDGAKYIADAGVVSVILGDTTKNVDFTLEQGGVIQGFVNLTPQNPAGADVLFDFPVVAYDAITGEFSGAVSATFSGGYRIPGIREGQYKIMAIPVMSPYAATYFGGGDTFDDVNSTIVAIAPGETKDVTIDLEQAQGIIKGTIKDAITQSPISGVFVLVYDETGHAISAATSGIDLVTEMPLQNPGEYMIADLRNGNYYVRTFALFSIIQSLTSVVDEEPGDSENPLDLLDMFGGILGPIYKDKWFDDVEIGLPKLTVDSVVGLLHNLRYEEFGIMPFVQIPPSEANLVTVSGGANLSKTLIDNINFELNAYSIEDLPVSVEDSEIDKIPSSFNLNQSYPNPVHRGDLTNGVMISFQLPETSKISISIFNILGQKIATVLNRNTPAGIHNVQWNGKDDFGNVLPSGLYFYTLENNSGLRQMKKLVVLK